MEKFTISWKFVLGSGVALAVLATASYFLWPQIMVHAWLFAISMWILLHVKKSVTTWSRFEEIDQRDSDFAEEVDRRLDELSRELKALKPKKARKPRAKKEEAELSTTKESEDISR